jgi:hypothetical protein
MNDWSGRTVTSIENLPATFWQKEGRDVLLGRAGSAHP